MNIQVAEIDRAGRRLQVGATHDRPERTPPGVEARGLVRAAAGVGLIAGWAELALVLGRRALDPHISMDSLRTNRHFVWMVPLSDLLIFSVVGLLVGGLARFRPTLARLIAWHLYPALAALALLLRVEGLSPVAIAALSCGVGSLIGPPLARRSDRVGRLARLSLPVLAGALVVVAIVWAGRQATAEGRALARFTPPSKAASNVLLIVLDNVRAESTSLYGYDRPTTPNLARRAAQGITFRQARSAAPWTLASHANMFTGRWCHELTFGFDRALDAARPTLAEALGGRGYATAGFVGNTFYCNARYGLDRGFARYEDFYENQRVSPYEVVHSSALGRGLFRAVGLSDAVGEDGTECRKTAAMVNRDALAWLDGRPKDRPFFVFLNYFDAHAPYVPPEGSGPRFGLNALSRDQQVKLLLQFQRLGQGKRLPADGPPEQVGADALALFRDSYESCIASLDVQIGRLFDELDRRGLRENTLVIVTSDHGEHLNEHGFRGHGLSVYDQEVRVPLLIFPPGSGVASGVAVDAPVSLRDLPATVTDLLGLGAKAPFPGRSLARFWNSAGAEADPVIAEVEHQTRFPANPGIPATIGPVRGVLADGTMFIRNGDRREEVYDLRNDPLESRNLVNEPSRQPTVQRLRELFERTINPE